MCWFQTVLQHKKTRQVGREEYEGGEQVFPNLEYEKRTSKSGNCHVSVHIGFDNVPCHSNERRLG